MWCIKVCIRKYFYAGEAACRDLFRNWYAVQPVEESCTADCPFTSGRSVDGDYMIYSYIYCGIGVK